MNKEIVFYFKNGVNKYLVYKEQDKYVAAKYVKDVISTSLSNEEKKLVKQVFNKMCVSSNLLYLGLLPFMGNKYHHYYDKENDWHTFTLENGSSVPTPIVSRLNQIFNYQDDIVYANGNSRESDFIKRIVKVGKKTIVIFMSAATMLLAGSTLKNVDIEIDTNLDVSQSEYHQVTSIPQFQDDKLIHIIDDLDKEQDKVEDNNKITQSQNVNIEEVDTYLDYNLATAETPTMQEDMPESEDIEATANQSIGMIDDDIQQFLDSFKSNPGYSEYTKNYIAYLLENDGIITESHALELGFSSKNEYLYNLIKYQLRNEFLDISESDRQTLIDIILNKNNVTLEEIGIIDYYAKVAELSLNERAEYLMDIVRNNDKLQTPEKELFLSNPDVFYDNAADFDYNSVIPNLTNLEVVYSSETPGTISGDYVSNIDQGISIITVYGCNSFEEANKSTMTHEFSHGLESDDRDYSFTTIFELINVSFNNDYYGINNQGYSYDFGYYSLRQYFKALAEIVSPDALRKYHSTQNIDEIKNELMALVPSEETFYKMVSDLRILKSNVVYYNAETKQELSQDEIENIKQELYSIFDDYYYAKTGSKMIDNPEIRAAFDFNSLVDFLDLGENERNYFQYYTTFVSQKSYINSKNPNYLQSSVIRYADQVLEITVENDIERALYFNYIYVDSNGEYQPVSPNITIENGFVYFKQYEALSYKEISLDELILNSSISR